jgi:hypothetical protein
MSLSPSRKFCSAVLAIALLFLFAMPALSRLMPPPSMADVRRLADQAPLVFRGQVMTVTLTSDPHIQSPAVATIRVDRWYRGDVAPIVSLSFTTLGFFSANGHDCIAFQPDGYWIIFALRKGERLEMIDDCHGALAISPLLGHNLKTAEWPEQMEADFTAGLLDHNPEARLLSIQRLGGLKLPSSRDALHRIIDGENDLESKWAVYAALRTGDISVLPTVKKLLAAGEQELPEIAIAGELRYVTDPAAAPELLAILKSAPGEISRQYALLALSENLKDPKTIPVLAAFLADRSPQMRFLALEGFENITHEPACTLPADSTEPDIAPQIQLCLDWWQQTGHLQVWR